MNKNIKKRHWACVFYPDSLPSNWEELLINSGVECCYAYHDKDIDPTGEPKKPHYHVILSYANPTTYKNVCSFLEQFNCPIPQPLEQVRGYFRYLTHKDNPEKYQYDDSIIVPLNGFDVSNYSQITQTQIEAIKSILIDIIKNNAIYEYSDLIDYLHSSSDTIDYEIVARNNTLFFNHYIGSRRYKKEKLEEKSRKIEEEKRKDNN